MLKVLVVDDSDVLRELLVTLLRRDAGIEVVGEASDGLQAVRLTASLRPDVVVMDVHLPTMDGLEATRQIMRSTPCPVVLVSSSFNRDDVTKSFDALAAGAVALSGKPGGVSAPSVDDFAREFVETVKLMSEVRVITRSSRGISDKAPPVARELPGTRHKVEVVAIAASTGGPAALRAVLGALPAEFPVPVLVVQHLAAGFHNGFVEWLDASVGPRVQLARPGAALQSGQVFVSPPDAHLVVDARRSLRFDTGPAVNGHRPSANPLFTSVANVYGAGALAVVLTGMGDDGACGARHIKEAGGLVLAQDAATSVVYGMPKEVSRLGIVDRSLSLPAIGPAIVDLVRRGFAGNGTTR